MRQPAEWQSAAAEAAAAAAGGPAAAALPLLCPAPRPGRLLQGPCLAAARCSARNSQEKRSYSDPTSAQQYYEMPRSCLTQGHYPADEKQGGCARVCILTIMCAHPQLQRTVTRSSDALPQWYHTAVCMSRRATGVWQFERLAMPREPCFVRPAGVLQHLCRQHIIQGISNLLMALCVLSREIPVYIQKRLVILWGLFFHAIPYNQRCGLTESYQQRGSA